ncbi:helix-turn-helix transcriptional regulator [Microbacterium paraoxydans]|uniref:Helix-turn-helix domain-containing protein n=1 Tax=Microbacterium paraoxydans TaxID=199592 RepID=A0ABS5ILG0_9MICO|nr:helix-turn-helix transcriptional regulator [Microbacterium paraoxydans]MBS0023586.1 helix-turn-helix domain-containing protein [Microbacterium paraoxydans]
MAIDRAALAAFLRQRRDSLQPEDVGLSRGARRRTEGLRREEVAALSHMSADYYARLERGDGPLPSEQMLAAIAQGLHLTVAERDHLFRLAGHQPPSRGGENDHVSPGMLRILDRLNDTPAEIVSELGETLRQTPLGVALTGETAQLSGMERSLAYRWFTDPSARELYAPDEHPFLSRLWASGLREVVARRGTPSRASRIAESLHARSAEFREVWDRQEIGLQPRETKHFVHPSVGALELTCQSLIDPEQSHFLLVYTATPGSESHEKLRLLATLAPRPLLA